jgi:hypothetical protein
MANLELSKKLWSAGLFILPIVVVKLSTTLLLGPAPHEASANVVDPGATGPAVVSIGAPAPWTPQQLAAARHISALRTQPFGPAPLLFDKTEVPEIDPEVVVPPPIDDPEPPKEIMFTVHAVMSGARGRTAVIDGRPYTEGRAVRDTGWVVEVIDCDARSVTLREASSGRKRTISVELPR